MTVSETEQPDEDLSAALAVELRALVGLRSRTAVRERVLPILDRLVDHADSVDREGRHLDRQRLVDDAIVGIIDDAHRPAAEHLLSFGSIRWQPLTRRGAAAAAEFGLGWDGYRRKRSSTGTSPLDETLAQLADSILRLEAEEPAATEPAGVADEPVARPGDALGDHRPPAHPDLDGPIRLRIDEAAPSASPGPPSVASGRTDPTPVEPIRSGYEPRAHRRRLLRSGGIAVLVLLVAAGVALGPWRSSSPSLRVGSPAECGTLIHEVGGDATRTELAAWREPFRDEARRHDPAEFRCGGLLSIHTVEATGERYVVQ